MLNQKIESQDELNHLVTEMRQLVEAKGLDNSEVKEKLEKMEGAFDHQEKLNQELTKKLAGAEDNIKNFERQMYLMPNMKGNEDQKQKDSFTKYMQFGVDKMPMELKDYLRTDIDPDGGYLVFPEYIKEIIKLKTEISPIRSVARVRTTNTKTSKLPIRTTLVSAYWVGEGEEDTLSTSKYGMEEMPIDKLQVTVPITIEELQDAAFNMETEINQDVAEAFAKTEGAAFVNGNGVKKPQGIMVNPSIPSINSGLAADFTMDNLIYLTGQLKTGYNPIWAFTRKTLAHLRTFKGDDGQYYNINWIAGNMVAGIPNTLCGYPYIEVPDMDEYGADKYPILLGDFARGYLIGDRISMSVIRDEFTSKRKGQVEFTFTERVGGQVINSECFIKLKCST